MKRLKRILLYLLAFGSQCSFGVNDSLQKSPKIPNLLFTENKGQVADQNLNSRRDVLFSGNDGEMTFHIMNCGISYQLHRVDEWKQVTDFKLSEVVKQAERQNVCRVDIRWLNANESLTYSTDEVYEGVDNFYLPQCPEGILNVKSYRGITLKNIYPNINLHYYQKDGHLKYDYIVAPNTDYKQIKFKVNGAKIIQGRNGSVLLQTRNGNIEEGKPLVYQNNKELKAHWVIKNNVLSFDVENYNPCYQLIIDPLTRLWGTYYGGSGDESGFKGCCTDANSNVYFVGNTESFFTNAIATSGAHQTTLTGSQNAFLSKFSSNGVRLWGTYYGAGYDFGTDCKTDASGNVFLTGYTSSNVPSTVLATIGAHQSSSVGGNYDAFLVKFNSNGVRLWGTYYGGVGDDRGQDCCTDGLGNIYMMGFTQCTISSVISTSAAFQNSYGGGNYDAFVVKFSPAGVRIWGSYYGGTGDDFAYGGCTDVAGNVFLCGATSSSASASVVSGGAHQTINGGGVSDAFFVKLNSAGIRIWGSFYGGVGTDNGVSCNTDPLGNVYFVGQSLTSALNSTVIATVGAHQAISGGGPDAFLAKFDTNGARVWATYYGGPYLDYGFGSTVDNYGNVYIAGITQSTLGPSIATSNGFQTSHGGGLRDAFLVKFNFNGVRQWGTFYGGSGYDSGFDCAVDAIGHLYLSGFTSSNTGTVIASNGAHQTNMNGASDDYLVQFECNISSPTVITNSEICKNGILNFNTTVSPSVSLNYYWMGPNTFTSNLQNPSIVNVQNQNSGNYTLTIDDGTGCSSISTISVNVNPLPLVTIGATKTNLCKGESTLLTVTGANTYTWNSTISGNMLSISPVLSTTYSVTGRDINGCKSTATVAITVSECLGMMKINDNLLNGNSYPNPNNGEFCLELTRDSEVFISNILGQIIYSSRLTMGKNIIDVSPNTKGIYFVRIHNFYADSTIKIIVQ